MLGSKMKAVVRAAAAAAAYLESFFTRVLLRGLGKNIQQVEGVPTRSINTDWRRLRYALCAPTFETLEVKEPGAILELSLVFHFLLFPY